MDNCFVCGSEILDSNSSTLILINLETKKYKTKYTVLIGNLINSEYELRIAKNDKICEKCSVLIEKYDELQYETKSVKSVLSRQIANTYSIETDEELIYMDKSKIFTELRYGNVGGDSTKYSCKICPQYLTTCIDTVNAHVLYHKIIEEQKNMLSRAIKDVKMPVTGKQHRVQQQSAREVQKLPEKISNTNILVNNSIQEPVQVEKQEMAQLQYELNNVLQEFDHETLNSLIDLDLLEDEYYDSNMIRHKCFHNECPAVFNYMCDYVRHLRLKHKSTLSYIFSEIKSNLKRPKKMSSLMCPYCFTKMSSIEQLESHVRQHEEAPLKNAPLNDRISDFIRSLMQSCRCRVCDCEILDPTAVECNHEIVKNGMAQKLNCRFCDEYFYSEKLYNNHLALVHLHCLCCDSSFKDKSVLNDHIRSHLSHSEYACQFCKDIYQTSKNRLDHIKSKHPTQCCTYCDQWYKDISQLEHHIRYAHADRRCMEQKSSICDSCGSSFKNKQQLDRHVQSDHKTRKIYKCSTCRQDFEYRYILMNHFSTAHNRTVVDNEVNFYKCCFCSKGFASQNRKSFLEHLDQHQSNSSFCYDCNSGHDLVQNYENHREKFHQDFSRYVDRPQTSAVETPKTQGMSRQNSSNTKIAYTSTRKAANTQQQQTSKNSNVKQVTASSEAVPQAAPKQQFEIVNPVTMQQDSQPAGQQIMIQNEDGTFLNMNNLILTDNGELIIQNLDGLLPNGGQETDESGQIQISNLEQFLIEQGLSTNAEISYIQPDMIDNGQVVIQNEDGTITQDSSLLQTYKEIFEPDDDEITADLIEESATVDAQTMEHHQTQNILLNGEYVIQAPGTVQQKFKSNNNNIQATVEQVDVGNSQALDAANQSTLDELGDILLEVAAAAEKEKKPKSKDQNQRTMRETLWGKKRQGEPVREANVKRKSVKPIDVAPEAETPARNFSQAYEFFVRGFDAKKQKQL